MTLRRNAGVDLSSTPESMLLLNSLYEASKGKGEGRISCTITKHRIAKTAVLLGVAILSKKPPSAVQEYVEKWAPLSKPGRKRSAERLRTRAGLNLECSSTQGLLEGVDRIWKLIGGVVSHRRILKGCLCIGLDSLTRIDPGKVRQLVSKLSPVQQKYWDPELNQWL